LSGALTLHYLAVVVAQVGLDRAYVGGRVELAGPEQRERAEPQCDHNHDDKSHEQRRVAALLRLNC
jgi:hypothetical protein